MKSNAWSRRSANTFLAFVGVVVAYLSWKANTDLSQGRFSLFMDEQISFDNIYRILHPVSWRAFWESVNDGGDHRYGRLFYNLTALVSFVPDLIAGVTGMIVADRMAQVVFLFGAYAIFVFTFIGNAWLRAICFSLLVCLPYSVYYATMPKPEPIQLFAIATFFHFHKRSEFKFGKHWFFLGAAFGTKISVITIVPLLAFDSWLRGNRRRSVTALVTFALGLGFAVPILFRGEWQRWIDQTFRNTGHPLDDTTVNAFTWLRHISDSFFGGSVFAMALFSVFSLFVAASLAASRKLREETECRNAFLVLGSGLCLTIPILLKVKRVWGFYLHPGFVLIEVGLFSLFQVIASRGSQRARIAAFSSGIALVLTTLFVTLPSNIQGYQVAARRTDSMEYRREKLRYDAINRNLELYSSGASGIVRVAYDPELFVPESNEHLEVTPFWGPFDSYQGGFDIVVAKQRHYGFPDFRKDMSESQATFPAYEKAWASFRKYTAAVAPCEARPCFISTQIADDLLLLVSEGMWKVKHAGRNAL